MNRALLRGCGTVLAVTCAGFAWGGFTVAPLAQGDRDADGFPCVGKVERRGRGACSGTVIGGGLYVLTAKHCLRGDGSIGAPDIPVTDITFNGAQVTGIEAHPNADLAILKLARPVNDSYAVSTTGIAVNDRFCGAGYGVGTSTMYDTFTGPRWDLPAGVRRAFYNTVDTIVAGPLTGQGKTYCWDVDDPKRRVRRGGATGGEGGVGPGDSGGGMFTIVQGRLVLVGVISSGEGRNAPFWGMRNYAVHVPTYKDWISSRIPTPGTMVLGALAVCVLGRRRS